MAYFIMLWGLLRLQGALPGGQPDLAVASLLLEGVVFGSETLVYRTMRFWNGLFTMVMSVVAAGCVWWWGSGGGARSDIMASINE